MKRILRSHVLQIRTDMNMTQEELARVVGVTRQTILAIEKGNYTPSVLLAMAIAKVFRKKVEDIFYL